MFLYLKASGKTWAGLLGRAQIKAGSFQVKTVSNEESRIARIRPCLYRPSITTWHVINIRYLLKTQPWPVEFYL